MDDIDQYINEYSFTQDIEKYILSNNILEIVKILSSKQLPEVLVCANDSNAFAVILCFDPDGNKGTRRYKCCWF